MRRRKGDSIHTSLGDAVLPPPLIGGRRFLVGGKDGEGHETSEEQDGEKAGVGTDGEVGVQSGVGSRSRYDLLDDTDVGDTLPDERYW